MEEFRRTPTAAAIGTNAYLIGVDGGKLGGRLAFESRRSVEILPDRRTLLLQYLGGGLDGVSPWCSYAYNASLIHGLFPDFLRARNYCDATFLAEVVERGPLVWINEPLIRTRVHEGSLSHYSGVRDYKSFITWVRCHSGEAISQRHIDEYRFPRLLFALRRRGRLPLPAIRFFMGVLPKLMFFSKSFRRRVLSKLLKLGGFGNTSG